MENRTVVLLAKPNRGVEDIVVKDVNTYRVGYQLIWVEYGEGSIIAVKRSDYERMTVTTDVTVVIDSNDPDFERINCTT